MIDRQERKANRQRQARRETETKEGGRRKRESQN